MYITMEYARIICTDCKKEVFKLFPGKEYKEFPTCPCKVVKKKTTRRKVKDEV